MARADWVRLLERALNSPNQKHWQRVAPNEYKLAGSLGIGFGSLKNPQTILGEPKKMQRKTKRPLYHEAILYRSYVVMEGLDRTGK